jgi:metal-sulfur cluster biosynthetic enzyme
MEWESGSITEGDVMFGKPAQGKSCPKCPKGSKTSPGKALTFFACLGILGLIAVSLQLSAPAALSDKSWENPDYKAGASLSEDTVMSLLDTVTDPEINLTVPELGLIYGMDIAANRVNLNMTLTAAGCPWSSQLLTDMRDALFADPSVAALTIALTFDPPWSLDRIDPAALERLKAEARQTGTAAVSGGSAPSIPLGE